MSGACLRFDVAQFAPPASFSAARRTHGLAKYLERLGHRVTVLRSLASGRDQYPRQPHGSHA